MIPEKQKILIVDDSEMNRAILTGILDDGYDFLEAENGLQALDVLRAHRDISLVLLDIVMPVMDGYEALRGVREISPDVPVIALTAYAFETDRYRMFQAGFNECLAKPLRADELRTRIAALLSR